MPRRPLAPWRDVMPSLQTGDLIFFRGPGWFTHAVDLLTGGIWSHVGMVIEARDVYPDIAEDRLLLWESTTIPGGDVDNDPTHLHLTTGPMLVDLMTRMENYAERWGYKMMSARYLHLERTDAFRTKIADFVTDPEIRNADYPSTNALLWYYLRERYLSSRLDGTFFCSELVAATYQAAGLLPANPSHTSYCPRDFSERGFVPRLLRSEFGQEIYFGKSG